MNKSSRRDVLKLAFAACATTLGSTLPARAATSTKPPSYVVVDLIGTFAAPAELSGAAFDINDAGTVVGHLYGGTGFYGDRRFGFSWTAGVISLLPSLEDATTEAYGVSNSGFIVGISNSASTGLPIAFRLGSTLTAIPTLGGAYNRADAVNSSGITVGLSRIAEDDTRWHGYVFDGKQVIDIPPFLGHLSDSSANDINERGQIVGTSTVDTVHSIGHAFIYEQGTMTDIGQLFGTDVTSSPHAINNSGTIVGSATPSSGPSRAFIYERGHVQVLGTLGYLMSSATDVNDRRDVVGELSNLGAGRAFLFDGSTMWNLNDLVQDDSEWILTRAEAINNAGWIVGTGDNLAKNRTMPFLLVPVHE